MLIFELPQVQIRARQDSLPPLRSIVRVLGSFWRRGRKVERAGYMVGALLLVSGLIHLGILVISGGTWEGPLSLRKATTFGLCFGLTLITIVWVAALLRLSDRSRAALLGPSGGDDRQVCC